MGKKIAIAFMGLLLVSSVALLVYAYISINNLKLILYETTATLEQTQTELQNVKDTLAQTQANFEKTNLELVQTENELKQKKLEILRKESQFNTERAALAKTAEENKFYFYYTKPTQQYGVLNLDLHLKSLTWLKEYSAGYFDCSEMSACIERELENKGFHTIIVVGNTPFKPGTRHAWLLVEVEKGKYMPVEATNMSVVYWQGPYFNNYFKYDREFETVQDVLRYSTTEFDWWAS